VFPFFLKSRLNDPAQAERKDAIETAFQEHSSKRRVRESIAIHDEFIPGISAAW